MSDCVTLSPVLCRVPCTGFGPRTSPVFALYCWPVTADPSLHCIPSHLRRWHSVLQLVSSGRSWPAFWPDVCLCRGSYILGDIQPTSAQPIKVAGSVMLIDKVKLYWNEWQYHLLAFNQPPLESDGPFALVLELFVRTCWTDHTELSIFYEPSNMKTTWSYMLYTCI